MSARNLPILASDEGLARYMNDIRRFPVLSVDEEYMLAKRYQEHGDPEAAHTLVTSHLRLVAKIAFGYRGYGLPVADLISEGSLGLMKAVKKFEPEKGFRLATYAMWWIKASVTEYILQSWSLVKLGTVAAQKKLFFSFNRLKKQIGVVDGQLLTDAQTTSLAGELGLPCGELVNMERRLMARDMSLNAPMPKDESGSEYIDFLEDDRPNPETIVGNKQEADYHHGLLEQAIDQLPAREQHILRERKLSDSPTKLEDLGKHYGISRERIRQLEVRAFDKVKKIVLELAAADPKALPSPGV